MPGPTLTTDALVLAKRPPSDAFQTFTVFSAEHGPLLVLQRLSKKKSANTVALDLFDEVSLSLENNSQGQAWFVKETRLLTRHTGLGRSYELLQAASDLARLLARNSVHEESRVKVYTLFSDALSALADTERPDIVYLKSLYRFARDEGYPVREHWFPSLPAADRENAATLLNQPAAGQITEPSFVAKIRRRLEDYLRGHTEILLD